VLAIMQPREDGGGELRWTGAAPRIWPTQPHQERLSGSLTGQDSGRGTFFHRHAVLHDQPTGARYTPAAAPAATNQPRFTVIDSVLSEEAVMGFEYGFSTTEPHAL
jgi:2-oxoglutarate dehydrogenase complex dehydrogenase (E1) component-like enzyme